MGLPYFIAPMLAVLGSPFDSEDYLFELKWDGFRTLLFREESSYRLMSRNSVDLTLNYPELNFLRFLPAGTVLDGELVAIVNSKPDFEALKSWRSGTHGFVAYIAFDLLYKNFKPRMSEPLLDRKKILEEIITPHLQEHLVLNSVVDTYGKIFFEKVRAEGLEGIIAKYKKSLYLPGRREDTWKKIKRSREILCVIIGFTKGDNGFKNLMLASEIDGVLKYVGRVGTGYSHKFKDDLFLLMQKYIVSSPVVPCPEQGVWLKPVLFCRISYSEFTQAGLLRAPVFKSLERDKNN